MPFGPKILIVSNQQRNSPLWAFNFTRQRLTVKFEADPAQALQRWNEILPDLIILDIDGEILAIEMIARLREEATSPILLLTPVRENRFFLEVYQAGLDECIPATIDPALFHAKVRVWLRRCWNVPVDILDSITVGAFHLIPSTRTLELVGSGPVHLTNLELRLLYYLMSRSGNTVSTEELCQRVWGSPQSGEGDVAALKNLTYRLRHKVEANPANPSIILTVTGVGYRFIAK